MEDSYSALIQALLAAVKKMKGRYDRKHFSYSWKASTLALTLGLFGVLAALRDQISPHISGGPLLFIVVGALTTLGTTVIALRYKWAERSTVALELKYKCLALEHKIPGECVGKSDGELKPVWEKLSAAIEEILQISVRNNIDPEDSDSTL